MTFHAIRKAAAEDVDWIVSQERRADFETFIHRWPRSEHLSNLDDPDKMYLVATDTNNEPVGFVILLGLQSPARSIELARMAVVEPGAGIGKPLLKQVIDLAFTELGANRLWIDVFDDNARARRAYRSAGFQEEGLLREAALKTNGELGSLVIMSILAREYASVKQG